VHRYSIAAARASSQRQRNLPQPLFWISLGRFVHHCHMMNHEDLGMMQIVEVYEPREAGRPGRLPVPARSAFPWSTIQDRAK
jgi:hypothetical protein